MSEKDKTKQQTIKEGSRRKKKKPAGEWKGRNAKLRQVLAIVKENTIKLKTSKNDDKKKKKKKKKKKRRKKKGCSFLLFVVRENQWRESNKIRNSKWC
jgi:hypothetical protein